MAVPTNSALTDKVADATIANAKMIDFTAEGDGLDYRLYISVPSGKAPPAGWPVIYVLDGNTYFASISDAVRVRSLDPGDISPAVVVGIGYPTADLEEVLVRRIEDLTSVRPSATEEKRLAQLSIPGKFGNADRFLRAIEAEFMARVVAIAPVDPEKRTLFGHSYGGHFTIHTLMERPGLFSSYIVISPSMWLRDRDLLRRARLFAAMGASSVRSAKMLLVVGSLEGSSAGTGSVNYFSSQMRANTRSFYEIMKDAMTIEYSEAEAESHLSIPWAVLRRALQIATPPIGPVSTQ